MSAPALTVITPSYRNDFELVVDLCKSLDEFLRMPFKHLLIVPRSDLPLFSSLQSPQRIILAEEDLLRQYGFRKIPFPKRIKIPGIIDLRIREQWYCRGVGRINGWVIQQLLKLSAPALTDSEHILFVDSDNVLFRPLDWEQFYRDGKVKLSRREMTPEMSAHLEWHANALELLGIKNFSGHKYNYIGNFIVWNRQAVLNLQQRVAELSGLPWQIVVARTKRVSEYILYGLYCEFVAPDHGDHVFGLPDLTCSFWTNNDQFNVVEMAKSLHPSHVALHIQSTIPMPLEERRRLISALAAI